jgi:hypothetical protein
VCVQDGVGWVVVVAVVTAFCTRGELWSGRALGGRVGDGWVPATAVRGACGGPPCGMLVLLCHWRRPRVRREVVVHRKWRAIVWFDPHLGLAGSPSYGVRPGPA